METENLFPLSAFERAKASPNRCPVTASMQVLGGKWKTIILWAIGGGINRFGALQRAIPGITKKMLTQQLRELEDDGLVRREVFPVVPPKVEYTVTERGQSLQPVILALRDWGQKHVLGEEIG